MPTTISVLKHRIHDLLNSVRSGEQNPVAANQFNLLRGYVDSYLQDAEQSMRDGQSFSQYARDAWQRDIGHPMTAKARDLAEALSAEIHAAAYEDSGLVPKFADEDNTKQERPAHAIVWPNDEA